MKLKDLLSEIKRLDVYPEEEWEEYISYFSDSKELRRYASSQAKTFSSPYGSEGILSRIKNGRGAKPVAVDKTISDNIVTSDQLRNQKKREVFTLGIVSGCYDMLNLGHVRGMVYAKQFLEQYQNSVLCAITLSDENIKAKKGEFRPVLNMNERLELLCGVDCLDYVLPIREPNCLDVLENVAPDYFFKARRDDEQGIVKQEMDIVCSYGGKVIIFPGEAGHLPTTKLIEIVARNAR